MAWVRVDDHFNEHPKLAQVGPLGWGIWLAGLAYCNRNLTDGFVPREVLANFGPMWIDRDDGVFTLCAGSETLTPEWVASHLVEVGAWDEVPGGYRVHDYEDYQPLKADVLAERAAARDRMKRSRDVRGNTHRSSPEVRKSSPEVRSTPVPVPVTASKAVTNLQDLDVERQRELKRIIALVSDADSGTAGVLASYGRRLPFGALAKVREAVESQGGKVGSGWVVNALKSEIEERAA